MSAHCLPTALSKSNDHVLYSPSLVFPSDNHVCLFELATRSWGLMALGFNKLARVAVQTPFLFECELLPPASFVYAVTADGYDCLQCHPAQETLT